MRLAPVVAAAWIRLQRATRYGRPSLAVALCLTIIAATKPALANEQDDIRALRQMVTQLQQQVEQLQRRPSETGSELRNEISNLRQEVANLRTKAMPVEPAEEIKKVTEWICEHGHVFQSPPQGDECPYDHSKVAPRDEYRKVKLSRRETLSDKLEERLQQQSRRSVAVGLSATGIVQNTFSGAPQRLRAEGSTDVILLARPALGITLFADLEAIGGNGPDSFTGSATGLNADAGSLQALDHADHLTVREAWIRSQFLDGRVTADIGKLDMTNYFDRNAVANDETHHFVSGMFVNNPLLGKPIQGVAHQANAPGIHILYDTFQQWRFRLGAQAPTDSGAIGRSPYLIGEADYSTQRLGGAGNYRLWGRQNGAGDNSVAFGVSFDQEVGAYLRPFGRYGFQFGGGQSALEAFSMGVGIRSILQARPKDETGFAFGWTRVANGHAEDLIELYHRFYITDHLSLSPIAQFALNLAGNDQSGRHQGVFLGGLRTQVDY